MNYHHTQAGTVIRVSTTLAIVAIAGSALQSDALRTVLALVCAVLLAALVLFHSLSVSVTADAVRLSFGIGVIGRTIPRARIRAARIVRNAWYYGWGIHAIPRGWLYNVSGFDAVELGLDNGRVVRIGTDEPAALLAAVQKTDVSMSRPALRKQELSTPNVRRPTSASEV